MRLVIFFLPLLLAVSPGRLPQSVVTITGTYYTVDTNKLNWYCTYHTLTLSPDSSFSYYSPCLNTEGKWKCKNNKIILNSNPILYGWPTGSWNQDKDYDKANNNLRVRILGADKRPLVCEELRCFYKNKTWAAFTDKNGCVYFPEEKFDSIQEISFSDYYRKSWQKYYYTFLGKNKIADTYYLSTIWHGTYGSFTIFYNVKDGYQHYFHFKNMEFSIGPEGQLTGNFEKQDSVVVKEMPKTPFIKK